MNFKKKTKLITMISLLAVFLLSVGEFAIGAYAAQPIPHENKTVSIVHESADILYYEDGSPYIHDILTNNTYKRIIETEYCMLAYNEKGLPLKLHWNFLDSSAESSYENLVQTKTSILPDQTEDYHGGWSLYDGELTENLPKDENGEIAQVAYSLLCLKQVVFEDGTVWNNPNYENWFKAYVGQEIEVDELQNYYPYKYELELN
ncbi:MAG: hypothetical protein K2J04_14975 [Lachnospiraceae bacterium]|nr:hypothetical protein [Lachnospiraceae bacterium]